MGTLCAVGAAVSSGDAELDALRRRLYAPDATSADIDAYRAAESATQEELDPAPPTLRRPRRIGVGVLAGAVLVVAAGLVLVVARPFAPPRPSPTASAPAGTIAVPAAVRDGFVRELRAGGDPGLLAYLDQHPATLLTALRTAGRADSTGFTGVGPTTLALSPTSTAERSGHVTVVLVTDRDVAYDWRATMVAQSNDRSGPEPAVATHAGRADQGEPVSGTVGYSGGVPTGLTLLVPTGTHWAAVLVYTY